MKNENFEMCKEIAHNLEAYANGDIFCCPECGEQVQINQHVEELFRCSNCGAVNDIEDFEQCSLWDYFQDYLDIDWILNSDREYKACRILVAFGGPNIYIDTLFGYVELYWWNETARYKIHSDVLSEIDAWAEELWSCC